MTAPTGTKTKKTKGPDLCPPNDIRENTKARRAWLAAEVERLNAEPNTEAKVVGMGSYQRVSVWHVTQVQGRVRLRGVCQCCGNAQVVSADRQGVLVLVLHGYNRPGWGYTVGRCPGTGEQALNQDKVLTETWHAQNVAWHERAQAALTAAEVREQAASRALYAGDVYDREPGAHQARPRDPRDKYSRVRKTTTEKAAELLAYRNELKVWRKQYPLHGAYETAKAVHQDARTTEYKASQAREHFARLLASGVHGTPLTEEVVA